MEQQLDEEDVSEASPLLVSPPSTPLEPRVMVATPTVLPPPPPFQSPPSSKCRVKFNVARTPSTASSTPSGYLDSVDALGIELPTPAPVGGHSARDANSTDTDLIFLESIARRENPERYNQGKLSLAVQLSEECDRAQNKDAWELADLLRKPHVKAVLGTHDVVTGRTEEPDVLLEFQQPEILRKMDNSEIRMVAVRRGHNEPLGMTVQVDENGNLLIARILAGGIIESQGSLKIGDFILEVNGYPVDSPEELQERIAYSKETITFKVAPAKEENNQTSNEYATNVAKQNGASSVCYMRALFNYNPLEDTLLPCKEIGLEFQHGDILQIVNQDDPNWWQAKRVGWNGPAGLIPSQELEERRKAFVAPDADYVHKIGICGTRVSKKKKKIKYQSKSNNDYDKAELLLYEEVTRMPPFKRRTLALVGSQGVGRRTLKNRLINSNTDKFGTIMPYTSRPQRDYEDNGKCYWFVDRETIESDIRNHKYLEYGEHKGHIYGTTLDSIREVINDGKMCVLDCSPAALKILHNSSEFMPYVIFIAAPGMEQLKTLHNYGRGSRNVMFDRQSSIRFSSQRARTLQSLQTMFEEEDLLRMVEESACLQRTYEKYIDYVIVNEDHDETFRKVVQQLETLSSENQWVPVNWVY
ncbi:protein PALS2 [Frankliniella occidentalis]|uniref:Protein PALS2 n=1 Tax=Frankliniella occidentalis TaxID=133901 RepID=A0A6J1SQC8_FRAOC|nr:protein PALS2 [Frankliniella occidentalis]